MNRPLFTRYPALRDKLPFVALGDLPTPVRRLSPLAQKLEIADLWIKCDDISAADYGGNKIRKLEFLLAAAQARGCTTVLTFGGMGSNHALATSINCQRLGLDCIAILTPEPVTAAVRSTLQYHQLLGTRLELARYGVELRETADRLIAEVGAASCYEVPFGGSSWTGATGFVNAALELAAQIETGVTEAPDSIYLACGTAGSIAGLALGLRLAELDIAIQAIQVTPDGLNPKKLYADLFTETNAELRGRDPSVALCDLSAARVNIRNDQLGEGYAMPTQAGERAAELLLQYAQTKTSLTYTAKTMAGLVADAGGGALAEQRVIFWNTYNSQPYPDFRSELNVAELPEVFQPYFS